MALVHMEMCAGGTELPLKCTVAFHFSVTLILQRLFAETAETMKEVKKIPRGKFVSASVTVFPSYSRLFLYNFRTNQDICEMQLKFTNRLKHWRGWTWNTGIPRATCCDLMPCVLRNQDKRERMNSCRTD